MNREERNQSDIIDSTLDHAIEAVKSDTPTEAQVDAARARSWQQLVAAASAVDTAPEPSAHLGTCAEFQATFAAYRAGTLPEGRRLLVEDHLHECVGCRKAMHAAQQPRVVAMKPKKPAPAWRPYAVAAGLFVAASLSGWFAYDQYGPGPSGSRATVQAVRGKVYRINGGALQEVSAGAEVNEGELIRTGPAAHAMLKLRDGSMLEVNERSEFRVSVGRKDTTVKLDRGVIIVEAAKRRTGHLYVASADCLIAVTGTVFSVNRGVKGSRVSVLEGEVHVEAGGDKKVLHAGDQTATNAAVGSVPIEQEIRWSDNLAEHLALLREFVALSAKLESVRMPGLRYSSRLLDLVPSDSVVVVSAPNLGNAVADAGRLLEEQLAQSPVLRAWWQRSQGLGEERIQQMIQALPRISGYLGDEVLLALSRNMNPVIVADVNRPGLLEVLAAEAAKLGGGRSPAVIVPESGPIPSTGGDIFVAVRNGKLVIAESGAAIEQVLARATTSGGSGFTRTDFGSRVQRAFSQGAGILVGADLQALVFTGSNAGERGMFDRMGVTSTRYLIVEQKQVGGETQHSAQLNFAGARSGVASWLAAPAPVGGLTFISPDAQLVASAVFKRPELMLDELMSFDADIRRHWEQMSQSLGIDAKRDLAAALGGELTFAIDGPMLPLSWKVVAETSNAQALQGSLEKIFGSIGNVSSDLATCKLDSEASTEAPSGRFYTVRCSGRFPVREIHYVYADGYIVLASSRTLLTKAVSTRKSGVTLARSEQFTSLLPRNPHQHFSGMVYQNAGEWLNRLASAMSTEQKSMAGDLATKLKPMVVCAYGEEDRLEVVSRSSAWDLVLTAILGSVDSHARVNSDRTMREKVAYR